MLKILVFDIETSPVIASVWALRDQNIALNQIVKDSNVIAWAAKWLHEPAGKTIYMDLRGSKDITNDKVILKAIWKLLDEADIVITQNGQNFDSRVLNARFIYHGMRPPSPYRHLDTMKIAKRVARFTSNKLEYLTDKLCTKYKKLQHKKFPGMELWTECLKGNRAAWNEMRTYNIHDVLATEELYTKLRAWVPATMPTPYIVTEIGVECGVCGKSGHLQKKGYNYTRVSKFRKYKCAKCGTWTCGKRETL